MIPLFIVLVVVVAGTSIWVLVDSTQLGAKRDLAGGAAGTSPAAWFFGCLLFWIVVFPMYLYSRDKIATATRKRADVKTCPRCAEGVKGAAAVCRFCGYEFG
jgi:hypothetical protein